MEFIVMLCILYGGLFASTWLLIDTLFGSSPL